MPNTPTKTKLLIIGSGPAGYTAAIYAARANLNPLLVTGLQPGGQLMITTDVENYPGFPHAVQGPWLMEQMREQAKNVGTEIIYDHIKEVNLSQRPFVCVAESGRQFVADSIVISTGAQARWLGLESESKFLGFGVSGCATCDGFFYKGKAVAVIGGGNTAVEEALYLTHHAEKVYLIHRRDSLRAEKVLQERLLSHPKIQTIWNSTLVEVLGADNPRSVTAIHLQNVLSQEYSHLELDGVFIAIGHIPATKLFAGQLTLDEEGYIICAPGTTQTSVPGVFAAGDVQDKVYRQAITAAGQGCMAALEAEKFLSS